MRGGALSCEVIPVRLPHLFSRRDHRRWQLPDCLTPTSARCSSRHRCC